MAANDVRHVLAQLPQLSAAERSTVVARATMLGLGPRRTDDARAGLTKAGTVCLRAHFCDKPARSGDCLERVHLVVCHLLGQRLPELRVVAKSKAGRQYQRGIAAVVGFLDEVLGDLPWRTRKHALIALLRCVQTAVEETGPLTMWRLADKMNNVRDVVADAFPGYLEAGVLATALLMSKGKLDDGKV